MSTTSYPQWPLPTVEPYGPDVLDLLGDAERSDQTLAAMLDELVADDLTDLRIYGTWHREAVARGMIPPYLVCVDDAYPMPVLELHGYFPINGRMKADVMLQMVEGIMPAHVDYEDLILYGAAVAA